MPLDRTHRSSDKPSHWYIATVAKDSWNPPSELPDGISYIKGQLERGESTDYEHWQLVFHTNRKSRRPTAQRLLGITGSFCEPTRSAAARDYVWKDATSLGSRFELGRPPHRANNKTDWDAVRAAAIAGDLTSENIPAQVSLKGQRRFSLLITLPSRASLQTMHELLSQIVLYDCISAPLALGRHTELSMNSDYQLTLKTQERNGGIITGVKTALSLMNFVEQSTFLGSSNGLTNIQFGWNLNAGASRCELASSFLLQTYRSSSGTQNWIQTLSQRSKEDSRPLSIWTDPISLQGPPQR